MSRRLLTGLIVFCLTWLSSLHAGDHRAGPGSKGATSTWTSGHKTGLGTSASGRSKVWYTLDSRQLTEVYYPRLDQPNLRSLDFAVVGADGYLALDSRDGRRRTTTSTDQSALCFEQTSSDPGRWEIRKHYVTDPARQTLLIRVSFRPLDRRTYRVCALIDPSIGNSGMHDTGYSENDALIAREGRVVMAAMASPPFRSPSTGVADVSDGWTILSRGGRIEWPKDPVEEGNVVQCAWLRSNVTTIALGFGDTPEMARGEAAGSLLQGFEPIHRAYQREWHNFTAHLPNVPTEYRDQFVMAGMVLKACEDKTYPGASVASISIPWGELTNADEPGSGGYHMVWSRDLYHVATAWMAVGDYAAAGRALDYLFQYQQQPDGSLLQNSWLDGSRYGTAIQMDEIAYPIILAWQLSRFDRDTYDRHIRPAAEFTVGKGPWSEQERWEEEDGYSPSTMAAEIAGLVCASDIARRLGRSDDSRRYRDTADLWAEAVDRWCYTTSGPLDEADGKPGYYFRINKNQDPNDGAVIELKNGSGRHDERGIVDAGFLELVRLGIRSPDDPRILRSLKVVDRFLRVDTSLGPAWYRYNFDGYGERADGSGWNGAGIGRLWPILTGERGEFVVATGGDAAVYARTMMRFASPTRMISEQVWDRAWPPDQRWEPGRGTGSATPLAWSMAQFLRLVMCMKERRIVEQPAVVFDHFHSRAISGTSSAEDRSGSRSWRGRSTR